MCESYATLFIAEPTDLNFWVQLENPIQGLQICGVGWQFELEDKKVVVRGIIKSVGRPLSRQELQSRITQPSYIRYYATSCQSWTRVFIDPAEMILDRYEKMLPGSFPCAWPAKRGTQQW